MPRRAGGAERWVSGPRSGAGELVEHDTAEADGLVHLVHAHAIAGEAVALLARLDVDGYLAVGAVGAVDAHVDLDAGGAGDGAGEGIGEGLLWVYVADALGARLEDLVAGDQLFELGQAAALEVVEPGFAGLEPAFGEVVEDAAGAHVVVGEAVAAEGLEEIEDAFAVAEAPEDGREGAKV